MIGARREQQPCQRVTQKLIALFAFGLIQYYILEVMLEIATLRSTTYFVPVPAQTQKS